MSILFSYLDIDLKFLILIILNIPRISIFIDYLTSNSTLLDALQPLFWHYSSDLYARTMLDDHFSTSQWRILNPLDKDA